MIAPAPRIVFLDAATYGDVPLAAFEGWDCEVHQVTAPAEVLERIRGRSIAVTNKVVLDQTVLSAAEARDLRLIAVAATGTDIIDVAAAAARGIRVCNVPGYATQSVAQFTIALILELATSAARYARSVKRGEWEQSRIFTLLNHPSIELKGKILGIVGYGDIGRAVGKMARALGMRIRLAQRPGSNRETLRGRIPLDELFRESDFVTLHCPLTPQTRALVNAERLQLMKPTAFLVNTARGGLIDEGALIEALGQGRIAGAAVDVLSSEPPDSRHPMIEAAKSLGNLIVTPHAAWGSREARARLLREVARNIRAFLRGRPRNLVSVMPLRETVSGKVR